MRTGYYTYKPHNLSIRKNKRRNGNLEQQAQALFKAWFVDFEPFKDGKFVDSELGKNTGRMEYCGGKSFYDNLQGFY